AHRHRELRPETFEAWLLDALRQGLPDARRRQKYDVEVEGQWVRAYRALLEAFQANARTTRPETHRRLKLDAAAATRILGRSITPQHPGLKETTPALRALGVLGLDQDDIKRARKRVRAHAPAEIERIAANCLKVARDVEPADPDQAARFRRGA